MLIRQLSTRIITIIDDEVQSHSVEARWFIVIQKLTCIAAIGVIIETLRSFWSYCSGEMVSS